jgi:hypothetical protein
MKILKVTLMTVLLLIGTSLVALVAINAFDESLTPQAARYGEPRPPAVPDAENGYYALLALAAGDGEDGEAYAKAWVEEARAAARENRMEARPEAKRAKRSDLCDAAQTSCLTVAAGKAAEVAAQLDAYREDLARYERLIAFRRYEEVLDYPLRVVTQFPPYAEVVKAQRAYVLRAALAAAAGDLEGAVAAIERDIAFQRVMLAGARTLLGKMVACAAYWRDLAFVADLLQRRPAVLAPLRARLQDALKAIDPAALRMSPVVEAEFSFTKHFLKNPTFPEQGGRPHRADEKLLVTLFFKPNASINMEFKRLSALGAAADLPPNEGSSALARLTQEGQEMGLRDYIYNPVGNILTRVAAPTQGADVYNRLRLHDLDAYNRLLGLRVEMMAVDVPPDAVAGFIEKSDVRFHDPYTGKPMIWDAGSKRLGFHARSKSIASRKLFNGEKGWIYLQL